MNNGGSGWSPTLSPLGEFFLRQQSFHVHEQFLLSPSMLNPGISFSENGTDINWLNIILDKAHILDALPPLVENMIFRPPEKFRLFNYVRKKSYKLFHWYNSNQKCQLIH